jgi:hypothetical protein
MRRIFYEDRLPEQRPDGHRWLLQQLAPSRFSRWALGALVLVENTITRKPATAIEQFAGF